MGSIVRVIVNKRFQEIGEKALIFKSLKKGGNECRWKVDWNSGSLGLFWEEIERTTEEVWELGQGTVTLNSQKGQDDLHS